MKAFAVRRPRRTLRHSRHENTQAFADKLVRANIKLVHKAAQKYRRAADYDELIAEGNIGLVIASKRFNPALGNAFSTFAWPWIRSRMLLLVASTRNNPLSLGQLNSARRNLGRRMNPAVSNALAMLSDFGHISLNNDDTKLTIPDLAAPVDEQVRSRFDSERLRERIDEVLESIPERERIIIKFRHLSDDTMTLNELGEWFDISRERVRQLETSALRVLRVLLRDEWRRLQEQDDDE